MSALDYKLPGQFEYRGTVQAVGAIGIDINMLDGWNVQPSDVVIATYPRSGTTWIGGLVLKIFEEAAGLCTESLEYSQSPYLELRSFKVPRAVDILDEMNPPRVTKTHLYYEFFKKKVEQENLKVIVVFRNPKDVIVSYYHHYVHSAYKFPGTFQDFFHLVKSKKLASGDIFEWTVDWWKMKDLPNVLAIKYEDMKRDCLGVVKEIAKFLGIDLNEFAIQRVVDACSFSKMKSYDVFKNFTDPCGRNLVDNDKFFRKGDIGDWKKQMNEEQMQYLDKLIEKHYTPIGLTFEMVEV